MSMFSSDKMSKPAILNGVTTKSVLRYTMMPEILPRIRALGLHFGHFAYLLALVFASARLLPNNHPALNAANIGRFGVRQVIAMAANNITWSKNNIDQIGIFVAIVMGLIMIVIQAGLIAVAALLGADPANAQGVFSTPADYNPVNDPVMGIFANVFGYLDGFWGVNPGDTRVNRLGVTVEVAPLSDNMIHNAIMAMLRLYSTAMMVIAVIIVLYYIMTVVGEAAKTGTPFGQRFNSLWAPIRLVVALGLLVPLGSGLNSAQYLTLWIAKTGSHLGTNIWNVALDNMSTYKSENFVFEDFENNWIEKLAFDVFFMNVCTYGHNYFNKIENDPNNNNYVKVTPKAERDISTAAKPAGTHNNPRTGAAMKTPAVPATHAYSIKYADNQWFPYSTKCGTIELEMSEEEVTLALTAGSETVPVEAIYESSKKAIDKVVDSSVIQAQAKAYIHSTIPGDRDEYRELRTGGENFFLDAVRDEAKNITTALKSDLEAVPNSDLATSMDKFIKNRGDSWAHAGAFYLEIARIVQADRNSKLNAIPNTVLVEAEDSLDTQKNANGRSGSRNAMGMSGISKIVRNAVVNYKLYYEDNYAFEVTPDTPPACRGINEKSNALSSFACLAFAAIVPDNLIMLANNGNANPMSALIYAGYEIVNRSWVLIVIGLGASSGGILGVFGGFFAVVGVALKAVGGALLLLGGFGLAAGVTLYFMLPVFPFMYFFFAIVSWVMEIFEAIIAMPLWALAHLRIDGDGMPGSAAISGYYLLLAIFLRPALIIVSLMAGTILFFGVVFLLQTLWADVLYVKGSGAMSGLEVLIYTIVYAYFCYSAGLTCFKLVDTIPNQILRWIGNGTPTFSDNKEDPGGNSDRLLAAGAGFFALNAAQGLSSGLGSTSDAIASGLRKKTKDDDDGKK